MYLNLNLNCILPSVDWQLDPRFCIVRVNGIPVFSLRTVPGTPDEPPAAHPQIGGRGLGPASSATTKHEAGSIGPRGALQWDVPLKGTVGRPKWDSPRAEALFRSELISLHPAKDFVGEGGASSAEAGGGGAGASGEPIGGRGGTPLVPALLGHRHLVCFSGPGATISCNLKLPPTSPSSSDDGAQSRAQWSSSILLVGSLLDEPAGGPASHSALGALERRAWGAVDRCLAALDTRLAASSSDSSLEITVTMSAVNPGFASPGGPRWLPVPVAVARGPLLDLIEFPSTTKQARVIWLQEPVIVTGVTASIVMLLIGGTDPVLLPVLLLEEEVRGMGSGGGGGNSTGTAAFRECATWGQLKALAWALQFSQHVEDDTLFAAVARASRLTMPPAFPLDSASLVTPLDLGACVFGWKDAYLAWSGDDDGGKHELVVVGVTKTGSGQPFPNSLEGLPVILCPVDSSESYVRGAELEGYAPVGCVDLEPQLALAFWRFLSSKEIKWLCQRRNARSVSVWTKVGAEASRSPSSGELFGTLEDYVVVVGVTAPRYHPVEDDASSWPSQLKADILSKGHEAKASLRVVVCQGWAEPTGLRAGCPLQAKDGFSQTLGGFIPSSLGPGGVAMFGVTAGHGTMGRPSQLLATPCGDDAKNCLVQTSVSYFGNVLHPLTIAGATVNVSVGVDVAFVDLQHGDPAPPVVETHLFANDSPRAAPTSAVPLHELVTSSQVAYGYGYTSGLKRGQVGQVPNIAILRNVLKLKGLLWLRWRTGLSPLHATPDQWSLLLLPFHCRRSAVDAEHRGKDPARPFTLFIEGDSGAFVCVNGMVPRLAGIQSANISWSGLLVHEVSHISLACPWEGPDNALSLDGALDQMSSTLP